MSDTAIRKILLPVDFSGGAEAALAMAMTLARKFGAAVELLHVWEPPSLVPMPALLAAEMSAEPKTLEEVARSSAGLQMKALAERLRGGGVRDVESRVSVGRPADDIVDLARVGHFDLVVMGTHGRTGVSRALLGSVAERVVRRCSCPVLTVHAH